MGNYDAQSVETFGLQSNQKAEKEINNEESFMEPQSQTVEVQHANSQPRDFQAAIMS